MSKEQEENVNQIVLASELDNVVVTTDLIKSDDFSKKYQSLNELIDYLTSIKKSVDAEIKKVVQDSYDATGESSVSSEDYNFTYVAPTTKTSFDSKAFKEAHPELYVKYVKTSNVAGSLRVTKREKKSTDNTVEADFKDLDF